MNNCLFSDNMGNMGPLLLWSFAVVMFSCQAIAIQVTYIAESRTFCETNATNIDKLTKSMSLVLNAEPSQMNLTNHFIAVCSVESLETEKINNFTDIVVFTPDFGTSTLPSWLINSSVLVVTSLYVEYNKSISVHYNASTIGNTVHTVLQSLNWPYIQVILQPTPFFRDVLNEVQNSRDTSYICAIRIFEINSTSDNDVERLLTSLQYETNTRGILVLADDTVLQRIIHIWRAKTELEQLYFVALNEDFANIQLYTESILGWIFIPRFKTMEETKTDISDAGLDLIQNATLRGIQIIKHFLTSTLNNTNTSGCRLLTEEENHTCKIMKWLQEMNLREQKIAIYNVQIDEPNDNTTTNIKDVKLVQTGVVDGTVFTQTRPWVLYEKNRRLTSTAVSWNKAFHFLCRSHISFQRLTSPFLSDVQIVGNLPLHYSSYTPEGCGELRDNYVLFSEAIVFAIDYVNNLTNILPNVKIGYDIIDTCSVPDRFIHQMDILYSRGLKDTDEERKNYIGGVGFPFSSGVESLAHYSYSKRIPTISISATSSVFSDKTSYPYFMRMVPSNKEETLTIIGILEYLSVHSIGIVYSDNAFGSDLTKSVLTFAKEKSITVAYMLRIEDSFVDNPDILNYLVDKFIVRYHGDVEAVVSLTQSHHMKVILQRLHDIKFKNVFWIGCDSWIAGIEVAFYKKNIDVVSNAILVAFETKLPEKFIKYMREKPVLVTQNPFFKLLIEKENKCTFDESESTKRHCNDVLDFKNLFPIVHPHGETRIIDAVIAIAHGLDSFIRHHCPLMDFCSEARRHIDELAEIVQKKRLMGIDGDKIYFDSKGDGKNIFHIMQIDATLSSLTKKVGMWLEGRTIVDNSTLKIPQSLVDRKLKPCTGPQCYSVPTGLIDMPYTFIQGDVMVYAFLELYENSEDACSDAFILDHFEVATSILWSILNINKEQPKGYPKIGLGIFASCGHNSTVAKSVIKPTFVVPTISSAPFTKPILGVIGAITNPVASSLYGARDAFAQDFPLIISASTERFNDRERYPRIYRTVMSATFEVYIAKELAKRLGWKYFHALFGDRDQALLDLMEQETSRLDMCLATKHIISMQDLEEQLEIAIEDMLKYQGATVVMVFIPSIAIETLLKVAFEKNTAGKLVFVIPKHVENIEAAVSKYKKPSLGLVIMQNNMTENAKFRSFYQNLNIEDGDWSEQLPWSNRFWEDVHKCNLRFSNRYTKDCTTDLNLRAIALKQSPFVSSTVNGVYALATAFQNYLKNHCPTPEVKDCINRNVSEMYHYLEYELDRITVTPSGGARFSFDDRNASIPLAILNFQYGPKGNPRFVTVGSVHKEEITLDLRKLSMYNLNGERLIFKSECPDDQCYACLDQTFVSEYEEKVRHLSNLPHVTLNSFESGVGLTTFFLIVIGVGVIIICTYYLSKFSSHKIFSLSADGHACIIIGTTVQILGAIVYLFDGSPLACGIHIALPGSVYSITLTGLLIKLNKTACLQAIVKTNITKLPKWDFAFTYLPIVISAPIIVFIVWTLEDPVAMTWSVPSLFQISNIEDITIQWRCEFNRTEYIVFMSFFWIILFLCMTLSVIYKCRYTGLKEVQQVLLSAICFSFFSTITTLIRLLIDDHVTFRAFMAITLPINGIIILLINFLPQIVDLMREKNRELLFTRLMSDNKTSHIASLWKDMIQSESDRKIDNPKRKKNEKVSMSVVGLSSKWRKKTNKASTTTPSTSEA